MAVFLKPTGARARLIPASPPKCVESALDGSRPNPPRRLNTPIILHNRPGLPGHENDRVTGGILLSNPAGAVRGPKYVVKRGKTPVLSADQARQLLDSIDVAELSGLRDRALIGVMVFTFARVTAVTTMRVEDYFEHGKRAWLRLHEKGGKRHEVPCHHNLTEYLDAWIQVADIAGDKKRPLFRAIRKGNKLTENPMAREDVLAMIKRRAAGAALPYSTCCHTFRATGITTYLQNGGTLEHAQQIAAHESPRTTKLYDRTQDEISLDEVERIRI
jgi:integrase/recombinase XerD